MNRSSRLIVFFACCALPGDVTGASAQSAANPPPPSDEPRSSRRVPAESHDPPQNQQPNRPGAATPPAAGVSVPSRKPVPPRDLLERQFQDSLTGATLEGIWQVTGKGGLQGHEPLSEPKTERYTIASATKIDDDYWLIGARIEFGEIDVTVPVPVHVLWAGDTPIITLDDFHVPMIGVYSARVMFHNGFYSGVWYSNPRNYGGILTGRIVKPSLAAPDQAPPTPSPPVKSIENPDREER